MGLDYSFGDALFLGILLVPGCLASRWLIPKVKSDKKHIRVINTLCVIAGIMFTDILLVIWYHLFKVNNAMWQNILENGFIRIHRSYLVNRSFITSYDNESVTVNEKILPISRKNREEVLKSIGLEGVCQ